MKKPKKQRQIAVCDAETDPFDGVTIPEPFIWGFYDGVNYEQFDTTAELIMHVYDKDIILFAHNAGKFDWHLGVVDFLCPMDDLMVINGRISKFQIGDCEFRDSYNILPTPLSAFKKDEIDYNIMKKGERDKPHNRRKIERYLYSDCLYLYEYIQRFIERYGLNLTLAGTAMKQWQGISGRTPPNDIGGRVYDSFKQFYYGGRCQAFEHGIISGPLEMVDINSAYPYAMLSEHPIGLEYKYIKPDAFFSASLEHAGPAFVKCKAPSTGALPYRGPDRALYFPDDGVIRHFAVTGWELRAAVETGALDRRDIRWDTGYQFIERINFADYVQHFWHERQEAKANNDTALNIFCKLFMNALYGKFGSNPDEYKNYCVGDVPTMGTMRADGWKDAGVLASWVLMAKELEAEKRRFYNVATAASITGFVRAFLWRSLSVCERPVYCDTDSILAAGIGALPNGHGDELGQWGSDGHFSEAAIAGRKLYALKYDPPKVKDGETILYKTAHKGVKISAAEIYKVAAGGEIIYRPIAPSFSIHGPPRFVNRTVRMTPKTLDRND